jgi:GNAT superfamily N-acetyltransferase
VSTRLRLEFEEVERELIGPYVALSRAHFADEFPSDPDHTVWKHLTNPQGVSVAHDLYLDTTLIGRIVYQIREFTLAGRTLRAGYLSDLLIHPDHRGLGNFLRLMKETNSLKDRAWVVTTTDKPALLAAVGAASVVEIIVGQPFGASDVVDAVHVALLTRGSEKVV